MSSSGSDAAEALFGAIVSPEAASLLVVGFRSLPISEQARLIDNLRSAQNALVGAAFAASFESGRVTPVCPDTAEELLNPQSILFQINPEKPDDPYSP